ncbi:methionyl-tRNA formyltransferase [Bdellovibrio sp. HCB117]|uniref:methionyl-tRNA formyltransferase n=1 Tax=Bdellovibrio sp. HCB117 TaxID=3394359 RepID=UPI0039B65A39
MKVIFLGATKFSEEMLGELLRNNISVDAVFSIPQEFELKKRGQEAAEKYKNSNYADVAGLAQKHGISCYFVSGGEQSLTSYRDIIAKIDPDIILVLGWYFIVPKSVRSLAKIGTFGIHASLLPDYAGGSPLVWALINGEQKTGVTMFKIEDGIDDGDILSQKEISIDVEDTIATLYDKVIKTSKEVLVSEMRKLANGDVSYKVQDKSKIKPLPIRTEKDGLIDWGKKANEIYNFIRAQTKPYPCAFSFIDKQKVKFVRAKVAEVPDDFKGAQAGTVFRYGGRFFIKTSHEAIDPLEIEVEGVSLSPFDFFASKTKKEMIFENE